MKRLYIDKVHPEVFKALAAASQAASDAAEEAGLGLDLVELVKVRASQINGCLICLSIHMDVAREAGVPQRKLDLLTSWQEKKSPFTDEERAALALAEEVTRVDDTLAMDRALEIAGDAFTPEQVSAIAWNTIMIGAMNRLSIVSGHPPRR
ncbi:carboxymuconolactone decarboxylase family protein [Trueperella bialowiezensis]|uniref:Arsenate reductase and related proteins, glutaredoxin family n=1 Tax=Trueperella bialowiezensis TaxID=312285 RepID=A0A3S4VSV9_9ACTO|nr:carboxymuconolactone decarboxylase family protein [Trueperella bialowiezensis]VEI12980.1 Arsenate reductase and related proteins, glutaredoxin family [Trueperella bialowiezensis]